MRVFVIFFLFIVFARAAIAPEVLEFNQKLVKFDDAYLKFRTIYCSIPESATGRVPCVMGDIFPYADWKTARAAAKKLFHLEEMK